MAVGQIDGQLPSSGQYHGGGWFGRCGAVTATYAKKGLTGAARPASASASRSLLPLLLDAGLTTDRSHCTVLLPMMAVVSAMDWMVTTMKHFCVSQTGAPEL